MIGPQKQRVIQIGNINQRKIVTKDGKISVSMSLKGCEQCEKYAAQINQMRKEIVRLNKQLEIQRIKNKQMDIICEEINKTKQKMMWKLESKKSQLQGNPSESTVKLKNHAVEYQKTKYIDTMWLNQ